MISDYSIYPKAPSAAVTNVSAVGNLNEGFKSVMFVATKEGWTVWTITPNGLNSIAKSLENFST